MGVSLPSARRLAGTGTLAVLLGAAAAAGVFDGATREVRPGTVDSGGAHGAAGGSYETTPSIGEAAGARMTGGAYDMRTGHADRAARPRALTDLAASDAFLSSMTLSWSAPGADGNRGALPPGSSYYIQTGENAVPAWDFASSGVKVSTSDLPPGFRASRRMTGLLANATYYFRAWHRDADGRLSRLSNAATAHTLAQPVTGAQPFAVFGTSVTINWLPRPEAPLEESAEGYRLEASTTPTFTGLILSSATGGVSLSTLTIVELAPQATYYMRVGALNHAGVGNFLALSTVTTSAYGIPPSSTQVDWIGVSSAALRWNPVNPNGYVLQASTAPDFTGTGDREASNAIPLSGGLTVTGLDANTTYYLRAGALWDQTTYYALASTRSSLAPPLTQAAFLSVDESSAVVGWAALPSAEGYRLDASTAADFSGTVVSSLTYALGASTLTALAPALAPNATYYFRVGSLNHASVPNYTLIGATPTLTAPLTASVAGVLAASLSASWTPVSAQGYRLEACLSPACDGAVEFSSTTNGSAAGLSVPGLAADTTYYLRAGGVNHAGRYRPGGVFASTSTLAAALTPAFAFVHTASITANWTPTAAQGYQLHASTSADFSGTLHSSTTKAASADALSVFSPALDANTTYYVRVGAENHNGVPNFGVSAATPTAALTPQALSPAALMVAETSATWNWAARPAAPLAQSAEGYRLEASMAPDFTGAVRSSSTADILNSTLTVLAPALDRNTTYYFRVSALNHAGVPGPPLVLGSTATLARVPLALPQPFPGVSPTSMTVAWAAFPAAPLADSSEGYLLEASLSAGFAVIAASSRTTDFRVSTLTVFSPALAVNDTYYFRVAALNHNGVPGPYLAYGSTATAAAAPEPGAPPVTAVSSHAIAAQWTAGTPANPAGTVYHLRGSPNADFSGTVVSSVTKGFSAELRSLQPDTTYYLQVMALNRKGHPTYAPLGSTITLTGALTLLPRTFLGVFQTSVTAAWAAGGGSGGYRLEASTAPDFSGTLSSSQTASVTLSTLTALSPALDANTTYYFRAAARNSGGAVGPFTVLGATSTLAAAPSALAAAYLAVNRSSVTAAWAARPVSPLSASNEGYRLEASTAANFSGVVHSSNTAFVLVSTLSVLSPPLSSHATYYFRVASLNHNSAPGPFLALGSTPTLTLLLDDARTAQVFLTSITASWSVVPSSGYVLEASSMAWVSGVTVSTRTDNPNLGALTALSPALWSNTTYYLSAGGLSHGGVPNFKVFAASSTLAAMTSGMEFQQVSRTSATVSWVPLPTAAAAGSSNTSEGYVLEASTAADFGGNLLSTATPNVSLSTLTIAGLLASTTYYYRVGSLNWDGTPHYQAAQSTGNFSTASDVAWRVQGFSGQLTGVATLDVNIAAVSQDRAFILVPSAHSSAGAGSVSGVQDSIQMLARAKFLTDSKVRLTRNSANNGSNYSFYVIDNPSGSEIFTVGGSTSFATAASQLDIPVSGVSDFTKTVVFLSVAHDQANTDFFHQSLVRGALTSNTNLRLNRTGGNSQVDVDYVVVEFRGAQWTVQTGETTVNTGTEAGPQSQAIAAVSSLARTWVFTTWSCDTEGNDQMSPKVELFDATTLRLSRSATTTGSCVVRWSVLENPTMSVQRGSAQTSATSNLTVAQDFAGVDTALSFPVTTNDDTRTDQTQTRAWWRADFTSSSQLTWTRARSGSTARFRWQVVSLVTEIAPAAVTNLSALAGAPPGEVELSWTSPGDDANSGVLGAGSQYRVHHTTDAALAGSANFFSSAAAQVLIATSSVFPGSNRYYTLGGLFKNTTYFMRLWTRDEGAIYSELSNGATVATRALPLVDPLLLSVHPSSITAGWAAFPDPAAYGSSNSAVGYLLEASSTNFGVLFPGPAVSSSRTYVFSLSTLTVQGAGGLDPNTTYYLRASALNHGEAMTTAVLSATATLPVAPAALARTYLSVGLSSVTAAWAARPLSPSSHSAQGYLLQASTAANFSGVLVSSETVDMRVSTLTALSPPLANNTTYYFRVGTLAHNRAANFIVLGSTATLARAPGSLGAGNTFLGVFPSSLSVAWTGFPLAATHGSSNSAQGFRLEASSTNFGALSPGGVVHSSFTPTVLASTLSVQSPALLPNTTYFVRVSALNHNGVPTTLVLGAVATLALPPPANGDPHLQVMRTSVTVAWAALPVSPSSASALGFRLEASTAADFSGTVVSSSTPNVQLSTLTVFSPALDANTTYYFRVASLNQALAPHYTLFSATPTLAPTPAALPEGLLAVFQSSVTAAWAALPQAPLADTAEGYVLQASSTDFGALAPGGGVVSASATANVLLSTLAVALPALELNTTYYLRVYSLNHAGAFSTPLALGATTTLAAAPQPLAQAFPGVFQTSVTAAWAAMPAAPQSASASGYRLEASSTGFGAILPGGLIVSSSTFDRLISTLTVRLPALDRGTTYYFRVAALNPAGDAGPFTALGATATLTRTPEAPAPLALFESSATWGWPAFASPPGDLSSRGYRLEAAKTAAFTGTVSSSETAVAALSTLTVSAPALEPNTTYYFRLAALNPNSVPVYSLTVSTSQKAVAPNALAADSTFLAVFETSVSARWQALPGAPLKDSSQGYQLEASSTAFDGAGELPSAVSSLFSQNTLTVAAPALERNTTYYFRVAGRNHNGLAGAFTLLYATSTLPAAPAAGAAPIRAVHSSSITAAWVAPPALPLSASAEGYRLEASSAADFSGTIVSSSTFERTASTLTVHAPALSPNTTYYLRVAALNHNGVPGPFTALGSTITLAGAPTLIAPSFLAIFETSATARWAAQAGGGYRLEASSTDFGALGAGGLTRASETFAAALSTLTVPGLDADTTWYFRVAALNGAHVPGPYSVLGATATLAVAPGAFAPAFLSVVESSITAQWAAAPASPQPLSAQGYRLQASTAADFTGIVIASQTLVRTAAALTVLSPALSADTTYHLRVAALNHNGVPGAPLALGSTSTLTIEVPGGAAFRAWPSSLTVTWIDVTAQGYRLEASAAADFSGTVHSSASASGDITLLTVQSPPLSVNTTYFLRVAALNHNGVPRYAALSSSVTLADRPDAPSVTAAYFSSVTVQWTPQAASGFSVDASTAADFSGTLRSSVSWSGGTASLTVANLLSGTTYYLRVAGLNHAGAPHYAAAVATATPQSPKAWTGDGGDGNWYTDANWSPPGVPGPSDSVTIGIAAAVTVDASSPAVVFSSMTLGRPGGGAAVSLRLSTAVGGGQHILINRDAGLTVDTTQTLTLSGDLILRAGSSMTHTANPSVSTSAYASWSVAATFTLEAGATVTVAGRGMPGGAPGVRGGGAGGGAGTGVSNQAGGGGGYGGGGGAGEGPGGAGGAAYGSAADPQDVGSAGGGGAGAAGGAGGGLLRVAAGTIVLDGTIDARGTAGVEAAAGGGGGGSGGGIRLTATTISGAGQLRADGGDAPGGGGSEQGGGGGGGRIRVAAAGACTLAPSTVTFDGGASGGGGLPGGAGTTSSPNLTAPTAFSGSVLSSTSVSWAWSGGAGAVSYTVLASTGGRLSGTLGGGVSSFLSAALDPNTAYGALVRAAGCAHAADSPSDTATTLTEPLAGRELQAVHQTSATFSWLEFSPAQAGGYRLEASTAADFSGTVRSSATPTVTLSTLTVENLDPGTTYHFRAGALNLVLAPNYGPSVSTVTRLTGPAPAAPALTAVSSLTLTAQWTQGAPANPAGTVYTLRASTAADLTGTVTSSATSASSAVLSSLIPDTTYYLEVRAANHAGVFLLLALGSTPTWTADVGAPAPSAAYPSSVTVSWTPVTAQGYEAQASTASDFTGTLHSSVTPAGGASALSLLSPALDLNTTYYIRVGGINHAGVRNFVAVPSTPTLSNPPSAPALAAVYFTSVTVSWTPAAPPSSGYRLEASTASDFSGVTRSSVGASGGLSALTVANLDSDTTYYLRVGALNLASVGNLTGSVSTRTLNAPKVWVGTAGDHDWNNAANWSPSGVPTRSNSVTINVADAVASNLSVSFSSLTLGSPGGAAVSLTLTNGAGVQDGGSLHIYGNAGLTVDTAQTVALTGGVSMLSGSTLAHRPDGATETAALDLSVAGLFDLQAGAQVLAQGKGLAGGAANGGAGSGTGGGAGTAVNGRGGGGGGYGGAGGRGENNGALGGAAYDSASAPASPGSGGGGGGDSAGSAGAAGGGRVRLVAGSIVLDGTIDVSGADGGAAGDGGGGGGAGGSIRLEAGSIAGAGTLRADGGDGQGGAGSEFGGGGGGGRIYTSASGACTLAVATASVAGGFSGDSGTGLPGVAGGAGTTYSANLGPAGTFAGAVLSSTSISWTWTAGAGALEYRVLASTGGARSGALPAGTLAFLSSELLPNSTHGALVADSGCGHRFDSAVFVTTTLARPAGVLAQHYLGVFESSATVAWGALPASPPAAASESAASYLLEASTAADFSGTIRSSATTAMSLSTLSVTGLGIDATYYFRVGTLNIGGVPNFLALGSTRTSFTEIGVIISTDVLDVGEVSLNTELFISTSLLVESVGNIAQTYRITAATITAGSPWSVTLSSGTDTLTVQVLFDDFQPAAAAFGDDDKATDEGTSCTGATFSSGQTCHSVPPGAQRLMWLKVGMPKITSTEDPQEIGITVTATLP
ncbi:MAG: fibronectin type III domain-containing protein [Elusimicrobia bacterium]|nr:fibronectin type III domain-containing protein [Elusimicrobiota bacterium]